jgi:Tol biopolymer transport system component
LWTLAPGDAAPRVLVDDLWPVDRANWAVAGATLVYVSRPVPDRPTLVRLDLATGRREIVSRLPDFPFTSGIALSPDGSWLAVSRSDRLESDLLWMELGPAS